MVREKEMIREYYPFRERVLDWPLFRNILHNKGSVIVNCQNSWFWGSRMVLAFSRMRGNWAQNGLQVNSAHLTNISGPGTIHNCPSNMGLTLKKEILSKTISGLSPEDRLRSERQFFLEIAVQKVKHVSSRVATATSPSYNMKEDRGHVGGLLKRCSDHVFYFHGGKGKKAIGRKKIITGKTKGNCPECKCSVVIKVDIRIVK